MLSLKKSLTAFSWNIKMLLKSPRFYMGLLMGFGVCFFLTEKVISYSRILGTDLQVFEPFIWCFGDSDSILFASLALLLPLSRLPRLDAPASYLIFRTGRTNWILGQVLTVIAVSFIYTFALLFFSSSLTLGLSFFQNRWSDTATVMSYVPPHLQTTLVMIRRTIKQFLPWQSVFMVFSLILEYMLFLSLLNLAFSLLFGKKAGIQAIMGVSFLCCFLSPERFVNWLSLPQQGKYIANLISAWVSPLQQATYSMHSNGYDRLPSLRTSHMLFLLINSLLILACFLFSKRIPFIFRLGDDAE